MCNLSCLARQLDELDALRATFPEEGVLLLSDAEEAVLIQSERAVRDAAAADDWGSLVEISGTINVPGCSISGSPVGLKFSLPKQYPLRSPSLQIICSADRTAYDSCFEDLTACVEENAGAEVLLLAVQSLAAAAQRVSAPATVGEEPPAKPVGSVCVVRKLIWFHHIKATTKRKNIVSWARELGVRGFSKPGFPGIILCEGAEEDVQEYCSRIRALRWQAMSIRAEESDTIQSADPETLFRFKHSLQELGEGDMDVLAAQCKAAQLDHLFAAAMKL